MKKPETTKLNKQSAQNMTEVDYPILVKEFGKEKAAAITLLAAALNAEARLRTGAENSAPATTN